MTEKGVPPPSAVVQPRGQSAMVRIFLVEDNDDLAALLARRIDATPRWRLERAGTFAEAASRLRGDRFDAVVLDFRLPDGDGLELLRVVRAHAPETPVLFLTAHGSEDVALSALGMGATDYMQKTGRLLEELPSRLESLLARAGDVATAARVVPVTASAAPSSAAAPAARGLDPAEAEALVASVHGVEVVGAALFDGAGKPLAARLPEGLDSALLGASLFQIHAQVGVIGRVTGLTPRGYAFVLEVEGAILAATTVGGRALVCVLVEPAQGARRAEIRLEELVARVRGDA